MSDEALLLAAVADRAPGGIDAAGQGRLRHNAAIPNCANQIILADDALAVADQILQKVENLGSTGIADRLAAQLAPVGVERVILEEIAQFPVPR